MVRLAAVVTALFVLAAPAAADNQTAGQQEAARILSTFVVPSDWVARSQPPAGTSWLDHPAFWSPAGNLVEATGFWTTDEAPRDVLVWARAHQPEGSKLALSGVAREPGRADLDEVGFTWPRVRHVLDFRALSVAVEHASGGGSAIRADGEAVWVVPRPEDEVVPSDAPLLTVDVFDAQTWRRVWHRRLVAPRQVQRGVALLNDLDVAQPAVGHCFGPFLDPVRLTFRRRAGGPVVARADLDTRCGSVGLTLAGKPQPRLVDAWTLRPWLRANRVPIYVDPRHPHRPPHP